MAVRITAAPEKSAPPQIEPSLPGIESYQAVAEIHMGLAGRGKIMRGQLIKTAATLHHKAGLAHEDEMFHGAVVTAIAGLGEFADGAGIAVGKFAQHLPAGKIADDKNELGLVR